MYHSNIMKELNNETGEELSELKYAWYKEGRYSINIMSYLTLGSGKANQTEIEEEWIVEPGEYNHLTINSSTQKYIQADAQMKPYYQILEKINQATKVLKLSLNEDKSINEVTNKDEILEKWEEIKKDLYFLELIKDGYRTFINIYDKEFGNIDDNIKHNLLFQIMFYPLPWFSGEESSDKIPERVVLSTLFPGERLRYSSEYKILKAEKGYKVELVGEGKNPSGDFETIYKKNYQRTLGTSLRYKYHIEGEYWYNEDSVLSEVLFHIKEELNEKMFYVCRYHIKLNEH